MQAFLIIVVVALLGGGVYLFTQDAAPTTDDTGATAPAVEVQTNTTAEDADSAGGLYGEATEVAPGEDETVAEVAEGNTTAPAEAVAETHVFDVSGTNFAFDVTEMRVKEGDTVTVNFTSADGFHDWVVDEFGAETAKVRPGDAVTSVTFVADKAGTYEYYCSVGSHRANGMVGTLIVE